MKNIQQLEPVLREIMDRWGIPGLGAAIVEGNQIVFVRGLGVQSLNTRAPVTPDSIFCVTSVSKCFVASAVMKLAEQGKVQLDAPLVQTLPYFQLNDSRYPDITIRQVLSHTSGMPDMDEEAYAELVYHPETDDGALQRYVRGLNPLSLIASPGEQFSYSNIAYNVLGDLIGYVSGQTFEAAMKELILTPAGMPASTFLLAEVDRERLAVPHLRTPHMQVSPNYPYHRADAPASFLHATLIDMCHWATTCLNLGVYEYHRVLSPDSFTRMWSPVASRGYPPFYEASGLGWTLGHIDGLRTVSHGGMGFGWTDFLILLPDIHRAAVILCNEESSARDQIVQAVVDVMLEREPQVGAVSWMVPVSQALHSGGTFDAGHLLNTLKKNSREFFFEPDDLVSLVYQLMAVKKIDLAIEVLELNSRAFPDHLESLRFLARLYLQKGEKVRANELLHKALSIAPGDQTILELIAQAR